MDAWTNRGTDRGCFAAGWHGRRRLTRADDALGGTLPLGAFVVGGEGERRHLELDSAGSALRSRRILSSSARHAARRAECHGTRRLTLLDSSVVRGAADSWTLCKEYKTLWPHVLRAARECRPREKMTGILDRVTWGAADPCPRQITTRKTSGSSTRSEMEGLCYDAYQPAILKRPVMNSLI